MDRTWEYSRDDQLLSSELAYDSFFWCCNGRKLLRKQQTRHLVEQISCQHLLQVLFQLLWEVGRDSLRWRLCQPPRRWEGLSFTKFCWGLLRISKKHIPNQTRTRIIKHQHMHIQTWDLTPLKINGWNMSSWRRIKIIFLSKWVDL